MGCINQRTSLRAYLIQRAIGLVRNPHKWRKAARGKKTALQGFFPGKGSPEGLRQWVEHKPDGTRGRR